MKTAFQTIIWGPCIHDLKGALDIIAAAGYQGVEFAQRPERIGKIADLKIEYLLKLLAERNLQLLGLAGGTLKERMDFCGDFRPLYLYVEDWDPEFAAKAVADGFTLALHPHVFKKVQSLSDAMPLLRDHPKLQWLPDTAHLALAGERNLGDAILFDQKRLPAVHLKDWNPAYGSSYYRYARGFTELGQGIIPISEVLNRLKNAGYDGWLVVEQDSTPTTPQQSALKSAQWLSKEGVLSGEPRAAKSANRPVDEVLSHQRTGFSLFRLGNFSRHSDFISKLIASKDPVSEYITAHLAPETADLLKRDGVSQPPSDPLQAALVNELNGLLLDTGFYNEERFAGLELPEEAAWLLKQKPRGANLIRLNRLLLEHAYPDSLPKSQRPCDLETELRFTRRISRASTQAISECYESIIKAFAELVPCELASLWAYNPGRDTITLLASSNPPLLKGAETLRAQDSLGGVAIERMTVTHFDLLEPHPAAKYGRQTTHLIWEPLRDRHNMNEMVSIPILNSSNQAHVRLILSFFPSQKELPITDDELFLFGMDIARAVDTVLDDMGSSAAENANHIASQSKKAEGFLNDIALLIQRTLKCEGVSIFLVNSTGDRLEPGASTGIHWQDPEGEKYYRKGEGVTGMVWEKGEALLTVDGRAETMRKGKSAEVVDSESDVCLVTPLTNARGRVLGIVRCRNKHADSLGGSNVFSDDDLAVIDAISQAAVPHLEALMGAEQRSKALSRLTHELHNPLVAIQGAIDLMYMDFEDRNIAAANFFAEDYLGDVWSYCELMRRLLDNANLSGVTPVPLKVKASHTFLMADVVAPAVRQVRLFLGQRNFSVDDIEYGRFEEIPRLWIDKSYFQQVIFNLLSNSIKFAVADPSKFHITIDGVKSGDEYLVMIRDWGRGMPENMREMIFEEGIRGPDTFANHVAGQGIGLSVVLKIIEAHGGRIQVTKLSRPTELTIFLPEYLAKRPPK